MFPFSTKVTLVSIVSVISVAIYADDTTLYSKIWIRSETLWIGAGSDLLISMMEKPNWFDWSNNTGAIDVKMDGSVLLSRRNQLLRCWDWPSLLN